jgi:gluconolactonase
MATTDQRFRVAAENLGFTEGPVWTRGGKLVVTSVDRGHLYLIGDEGPSILAVTGGGANGATEGADGSLYVTQNSGRGPWFRRPPLTGGVQRVWPDGLVEWVTMDPVSPNDLCFGPDGLLYFTDPSYPASKSDGRLWRVDVDSKETELLMSVPWFTNGIGFGLEDDVVYVADSGGGRIVSFPLTSEGLGKPETHLRMNHGRPDGFAFDVDGNFIIGALPKADALGDLQVWSRDGKLLECVQPGDNRMYTNIALDQDRRMAVTAADAGSVFVADAWPAAGLPLHPFR